VSLPKQCLVSIDLIESTNGDLRLVRIRVVDRLADEAQLGAVNIHLDGCIPGLHAADGAGGAAPGKRAVEQTDRVESAARGQDRVGVRQLKAVVKAYRETRGIEAVVRQAGKGVMHVGIDAVARFIACDHGPGHRAATGGAIDHAHAFGQKHLAVVVVEPAGMSSTTDAGRPQRQQCRVTLERGFAPF